MSQSEEQGVLFALLFEGIGLRRSIVLLDTPELHLHPTDHARFFHAICKLGEDNQIVVATASPAIVAAVSPADVIELSPVPEGKR